MATIYYGHGNGTPGTLTRATDKDAVRTVRDLVRQGFRNATWATVELSDKRVYQAHNAHGRIVSHYLSAI